MRDCPRRREVGKVPAEGIQPVATEERKTSDERGGTSDECNGRDARCPSGVINKRGSYQQAPASSPKKAEGKRGIPPLTPYGEKGRVKKQDGGSFGTLQDRAGAHAHARRLPCSCSYAEAGEAVLEILDNCFGSVKKDCRLWAWYCRHFDRRRIVDQAYYYASCQRCGEVKNAVSAFQSWLRQEFGPKGGVA